MSIESDITDSLDKTRAEAAMRSYTPKGTVRCAGTPLFRTELARDYGCLLDLDAEVIRWSCLQSEFTDGRFVHIPDFFVERRSGWVFVDVLDENLPLPQASIKILLGNTPHEFVTAQEINAGFRLQNAKDLLRYAQWRTPLGDRLRLLAALDEHGSLSVAECLTVFRETLPIAGLASLILHRFIEIELDIELINPDTTVRRNRD
ncbi:hypothetical protein [Phyllobacterium sp. K27]